MISWKEKLNEHIKRATRMIEANEALIAENQKILKAQDRELEPKRFETRVLKDDGLGPAPRSLEDLTDARIVDINEEDELIILEIVSPSGADRAYTSKEEPHILRWSSNQVPVPFYICRRMGWPWLDEQQEAAKKDFREDMRNWINGRT